MILSDFIKRLKFKKAQRVKTPTILQMDNAECGAVALAIILGYYGRYILPSEAREACDVTRDGSKAINIIKAARHFGMDAHGMQITMDTIKIVPIPFIVYWEFNHFLVVEGFSDEKVYLNDPATGPRTVSYQEFDRSFTGVVLFLTPSTDFHPGGEADPSIIKLVWRNLYPSWFSYLFILLAALALVLPNFALAFFTKVFIDNILINNQRTWIVAFIFGMMLSAGMIGLLTWIKRHYLNRLYIKLKLTGVTDFFWHLIHLPLNFFQQRASGDIAERIEAYNRLANMLANQVTNNIVGLFTMNFFAIVMIFLNWQLALVNIGMAVLNFLLVGFFSRHLTDIGRSYAQNEGKLAGIEVTGIQIIETLKANALEDQFFNQWASYHAKKIASHQKVEIYTAWLRIIPTFLRGINTLVLLCWGSWFIIQGESTVGTIIALQILLLGFNKPLDELLELGESLYKLKGDVARIRDINNHTIEHILNASTQITPLLETDKPLLELSSVSFGYSRLEPPIFTDFSFNINPGERVAIVGPSGGGKSSLSRLICGLFAPWAGEISLNGVPLANISRATFVDWVGLVDQQIFLFAATVRDNLTLWDRQITNAQIYQALEAACVADVIAERGGLSCMIEEGGRNFSGGQAQRIEIARALLHNPRLLILDEATSALDPMVEKKIYDNLKKKRCALLIIAHRLSAVRDSDRIIVMDNGKIIQQGQHESLMHEPGLYQELVSLEIQ